MAKVKTREVILNWTAKTQTTSLITAVKNSTQIMF